MDLSELWIGDLVRLLKSQRIGKFHGVHKTGKARILIGDKIILTASSNIQLLSDAEIKSLEKPVEDFGLADDSPILEHSEYISLPYHHEDNLIDLHLETLQPAYSARANQTILEYQLECLSDFLHKAILKREYSIKIIHGKGTGVLRDEVINLIKFNPNVLHYSSIQGGGGVEVIFNYQKG